MRKAILISIDGWGTNFLGTYGNSLCATPHLDRLAACSKVYDRAYASSPLLDVALQSISNGRHPLEPSLSGHADLAEVLQTFGKQSIFLTDDPEVADLPWVQSFNESFCYDPTRESKMPSAEEPTDWTDTRLATFLEAALGELARYSDQVDALPDWTWIHLSGLAKTWDAPYDDRFLLCDEEDDPDPPRGIEPIAFEVTRETDPDAIFGAACVAAAQARIIDELWSWLDAFLNETVDRSECLVILTGVRGYPLGEHRNVGLTGQNLASELIHIPLLVQPGKMPIGTRDATLVQPMSIWPTVLRWLVGEQATNPIVAKEIARRRVAIDLAIAGGEDENPNASAIKMPSISLVASENGTSLLVPQWSAVWQPALQSDSFDDSESLQLFLSPDDRWQQNDAASRAVDISEAMRSTRDAYVQWLRSDSSIENRPPLPECLSHRV